MSKRPNPDALTAAALALFAAVVGNRKDEASQPASKVAKSSQSKAAKRRKANAA